MIQLFQTFLTDPLFNLLVFLYNTVAFSDLGLAIIFLTIIIKVLLFPLSHQSIKSQKVLQDLQPKMEAIKKQYKGDKEGQAKAMMQLYKTEKVNPLSSCLPLLIQLPFLLAVYHVFIRGFDPNSLNALYPFIARPDMLAPVSLGFIDLSQSIAALIKTNWLVAVPNIVLILITGGAQFYQAKMLLHKSQPKVKGAEDENMMATVNKQMMYMMPAITVFIGFSLPSGLMLYWLVTTLLTIAQQKLIFDKIKKTDNTVEVIS